MLCLYTVYALSPYDISNAQRHCSITHCLLLKHKFPQPPYCYLNKRYVSFENLRAINAAIAPLRHKFAFIFVTTMNPAGTAQRGTMLCPLGSVFQQTKDGQLKEGQ